MEIRGEIRGVAVIDDFAHHPTAIRETIDAIRQKYKGRRIVAVFEPAQLHRAAARIPAGLREGVPRGGRE